MSKYDEPWFDDGYRVYAKSEDGDPRNGHMIFEYKHVDGAKKKHYERIIACVNACAGIEDPEAFVKSAEELAKLLRRVRERCYYDEELSEALSVYDASKK